MTRYNWQLKKQILALLANGLSVKDISDTIGKSPNAIFVHIRHLKKQGYVEKIDEYRITDKGKALSK